MEACCLCEIATAGGMSSLFRFISPCSTYSIVSHVTVVTAEQSGMLDLWKQQLVQKRSTAGSFISCCFYFWHSWITVRQE